MEILLILFLVLLNGAFAMSELAIAAARAPGLRALAEEGDGGAKAALKLMEAPTQFLSSVQVGITSIGLLNGIIGQAAYSDWLAQAMTRVGLELTLAQVLATALVVTVITFVTIVFGEIVPKRIGQMYPEAVARVVARPMTWIATLAKPFVDLLSHTTRAVLRALKLDDNHVRQVTEEEIEAQLEESVGAGVLEAHEHRMVRNIMALDDRSLASIMVPRADLHTLEVGMRAADALELTRETGHSWYPVCRGGPDRVLGVIHVSDLLDRASTQPDLDLSADLTPPVFVPETLSGLELLEQYRDAPLRVVFVVDEYGVVQGLLTPRDLLEAITGELHPEETLDAWALANDDGSWVLDGAMPVSELKARLELKALPEESRQLYNTVAGLMLYLAGRLLTEGQSVDVLSWRLTVLALQGRRIQKVVATAITPDDTGESA
ncbi:MAG: hemolysin family protein [Burkholderiaceae bacterium]|jgi:putative hemolysin